MRALVIGFGSIGARHARILTELGHDVAVVSRHATECPHRCHPSLESALSVVDPDYVVVANSTADHFVSLQQLADWEFAGRVLVEKPLFSAPTETGQLPFASCSVAYNLRFHPMIERMREELVGQRCISAMCYVGQHLPDWRPGTDYRQSYSARAAGGGGALRDLSHELDYLAMLFGPCGQVYASGGHLSDLEIDSDDLFAMQMCYRECPVVQLQLNYIDRPGQRFVVINTACHTLIADLSRGVLTIDGRNEQFTVERDYTYRAMHQHVLSGGERACSLAEAQAVLKLIIAAEASAQSGERKCLH